MEGAKVGYVRGLWPRSSCGSGAAVAEATTVDMLDRMQSWVLWQFMVHPESQERSCWKVRSQSRPVAGYIQSQPMC